MADFRSYLASVDPYAAKYTGNDGRIDMSKSGYDAKGYQSFQKGMAGFQQNQQGLQKYVSGLYNDYQSKQAAQPNSQLSALQSQLNALQNQLAYQPKLASFDVLGNYNRARSTAESNVNPLYNKYLNDFLAASSSGRYGAAEGTLAKNKRTGVGLVKEANALDLSQTLAGNQVNRQRTTEDTTAAIGKLNEQEGQFQQDSGTQFDRDRRALAENNAASGLTATGVGNGRMFDQTEERNIDESRKVQEFGNQRAAKQLFQTRTLEDLERGDKDAQAVSDNKDKSADFDLESYLDELAAGEVNFRNDNEVKRLNQIAQDTGTYAQQGTQSFLQSLAGSGYRPQDIALAYQVYG